MSSIIGVIDDDSDRLALFDVADPANIVAKDYIDFAFTPYDLFILGNYAYITGRTSLGVGKFGIYNISDPTNISQESLVIDGTISSPRGVFVLGDYAYITDISTDTLSIWDISNPASPSVEGSVVLDDALWDVFVVGNTAFVAGNVATYFYSVDVSDKSNPVELDSINTNLNRPGQIEVTSDGSVAFLGCPEGSTGAGAYARFSSFDVSTPSSIATLDDINFGDQRGVFFSKISLWWKYLIGGGNQMGWLYDVSTPSSLTIKGAIGMRGGFSSFFIKGNNSYGVNANCGLVSFDSSGVEGVKFLGDSVTGAATSRYSGALDVSGNYAYVMDRGSGTDIGALRIFDISDPTSIVAKDTQSNRVSPCVSKRGDIVYTGDWYNNRLWAYNVSDVTNITTADYLSSTSDITAIDTTSSGLLVFTETNTNTIRTVNIVDPTNISAIDSLVLGTTTPRCVKISGDYAFVATTTYLESYDISDSSDISFSDSIVFAGTPSYGCLDIVGDFAFMATSAGLEIFDISDPTDISAKGVSIVGLPASTPQSIAVSGNFAFILYPIATTMNHVAIFDVSDKSAPFFISSSFIAGASTSTIGALKVSGDTLVSCFGQRIGVLDITNKNGIVYKDNILTNLSSPVGIHGLQDAIPVTTTFKPKVMVI